MVGTGGVNRKVRKSVLQAARQVERTLMHHESGEMVSCVKQALDDYAGSAAQFNDQTGGVERPLAALQPSRATPPARRHRSVLDC